MKQYFRFSACLLVLTVFLTGCSCFCPDGAKKSNFEYTGLFLKVVDGDTFKAHFHGKIEYIRLAEVDCFEIGEGERLKSQAKAQHISTKQALKKGKEAEIKLADLLMHNGLLNIVPLKRDKYGRVIAQVYAKDDKGIIVNVNQYMYYKGLCSAFPDKSYYNKKAD